MHRRAFLRSVGVLAGAMGAGGLVTACGDGGGGAAAGSGAGIPEGETSLNVVHASIETLAGTDRRFAFGLTSLDNVPVKGTQAAVYVRDLEGQVLSGPSPAEFFDEGGSPLGLYLARIDVPTAGHVEVAVVTGDRYGTAAISVIAPEDSTVPVPGAPAVAVATPTTAQPLDASRVCTNDPPCPMHEVSLDEALRAGRPVALMFATPAYCTSALCAPAVDTLDELRQSRDWGDTAFIHVEIFSDEGQTVLPAVHDWGLRSEPWFFAIGPDGTVVDRVDGPMIGSELSAMLTRAANV